MKLECVGRLVVYANGIYLFDPSFEVIIGQAVRRGPFSHDAEVDRITSRLGTLSAFRSALQIEIGLSRDWSAESLISVLNFASPMLDDVIRRDHAIKAGSEPVFDRAAIFSGFAAVVQYMESSVGFSTIVLGDPDINERERPGLERKISTGSRTRLQFSLAGPSSLSPS